MTWIRNVAELIGPESWVVRLFRPVREWALEKACGSRGLERSVNDVPMRCMTRYRWYFSPTYDSPVASYFRSRVRPGAVCVSIGANLGIYPLQFAAWSAPDGVVYAVEPNPQTATVLRTHVVMNGLAGRAHVVEQAISDRRGEATFLQAGVDGMSRLGQANPALEIQAHPIRVNVDSIDNFCASHGIRPAALMIDIEGFEARALAGARDLFASDNPPVTVVEMHPNAWSVAGTDRAAIEDLLREYRLHLVPLSGQADVLGEYGHAALERDSR